MARVKRLANEPNTKILTRARTQTAESYLSHHRQSRVTQWGLWVFSLVIFEKLFNLYNTKLTKKEYFCNSTIGRLFFEKQIGFPF